MSSKRMRAELVFKRDVHYVLDNQQIQLIDGSTGRIFSDRTWSEGLHQAVEAKEGLPISSERSVVAQDHAAALLSHLPRAGRHDGDGGRL